MQLCGSLSILWHCLSLGLEWKLSFSSRVAWSWNSNTLATWCKELTRLKRPWCWERLKAGREGDDRGWDGRMASLTQWTWVWVSSGSWWWTGKLGVQHSPWGHKESDMTERLKWTECDTSKLWTQVQEACELLFPPQSPWKQVQAGYWMMRDTRLYHLHHLGH